MCVICLIFWKNRVFSSKICGASAWELPFFLFECVCVKKIGKKFFEKKIGFFSKKSMFSKKVCFPGVLPQKLSKNCRISIFPQFWTCLSKKIWKMIIFQMLKNFFFNFSPYQVQCEFQLALNSNNSGWMLSSVENLVLLACVFSSKEVRARTPCKQDGYCCLTN
jgi:hypothetical protein